MPLYRLLQERVYEPETIKVMVEAYERALVTLQLKGRSDALTRLVAEKVIATAEAGVRDADGIYTLILADFTTSKR